MPSDFRYREVEKQILQMVDDQVFKPGQRLPSLRRLSRNLGVSISTVSQAYLELERKGVVEARERAGFFLVADARRLPPPPSRPRLQGEPTMSHRSGLIQTVLKALGNRDLLPFGVVCPASELLPGRTLTRLLGAELRARSNQALDYVAVNGLPELRRQIALRALQAGIRVSPEEVLITSGAMEGLAIALRAVTRPGDTVLIQSPSYFCFLQLLENCGLRAVEIPSTTGGIDPEDVRRAIERNTVRAAIMVPNFNNPDGSFTDDQRKQEIVTLLAEHAIPLIEDDVYGDLHFGENRPACCKSYDRQGEVLLCSSFSKTIAPGFRVGWMLPGKHMAKALELKTTTNICTATPNQMAIAAFLGEGYYERHLRRLRSAVHGQMEILLPLLRRHFPEGTRAEFPEGGASVWVELPSNVDAVEYFYEARAAGVGVAPGPIFTTQDHYNNFIRLSCNGVWSEELERGVGTLGEIARRMEG